MSSEAKVNNKPVFSQADALALINAAYQSKEPEQRRVVKFVIEPHKSKWGQWLRADPLRSADEIWFAAYPGTKVDSSDNTLILGPLIKEETSFGDRVQRVLDTAQSMGFRLDYFSASEMLFSKEEA